ncbi:MAG: hypothetical protein KDK00_12605 [Rhodobacteraceae bacterium]|nr:hypothetical protein [Paracoccaceae bacterium]
MQTNHLPKWDQSDKPTGCCPRFKPDGWDGQALHLSDKAFVRADTRSAFHIPLNMGRVFDRVLRHLDQAGAVDTDDYIVLSRDMSPWKSEHYFAVQKPVPGEQNATLSGDFVTKVFEGPFRDAGKWHAAMSAEIRARGKEPSDIFFFYTTCPKCARIYGKNYVVGVGRV